MGLRLSAGLAAGMKLHTPKGYHTRPTSARVREALMSMLGQHIQEGAFVDVFAGSGAVGLEALSRGAHGAVFIEQAPDVCRLLKQNCAELLRRCTVQGLAQPSMRILCKDAFALQGWQLPEATAVAFADPPYVQACAFLQSKLMQALLRAALRALVVEVPSVQFKDTQSLWPQVDDTIYPPHQMRTYGAATLAIWYPRLQGANACES